jgi:hypothetical protein
VGIEYPCEQDTDGGEQRGGADEPRHQSVETGDIDWRGRVDGNRGTVGDRDV